MSTLLLLVFPPLAGIVITLTGRKLLGDTNTTFIATVAMCAAVGVGFAITVLG